MTESKNLLSQIDIRLCRLCLWQSFEGFGLRLEPSSHPPHLLRMIESNSPAAASGLKSCDVILAINHRDMTKADFHRVQAAVRTARKTNTFIILRVMEQQYYEVIKKKKIPLNSISTIIIDAPNTMPDDFINFPRLTLRVCDMRFGRNDTVFGFTTVNGENDIGVYIQTVSFDSPASEAGLRKSDRIIEINDRNVNIDSSEYILHKLNRANRKGVVKLLVADTQTYEYYIKNNIQFSSTDLNRAHPSTDQNTIRSQNKNRKSIIKESDPQYQTLADNISSKYGTVGPTRSNALLPPKYPISNDKQRNDTKAGSTNQNYTSSCTLNRRNNGTFTRRLSQIFSSGRKSNITYSSDNKINYDNRTLSNDTNSISDDISEHKQHTKYDFDSMSMSSSRSTSTIRSTRKDNFPQTAENRSIVPSQQSSLKWSSMIDLRKMNQSPTANTSLLKSNICNGTIQICLGDLTKQMIDAVVVASTSDRLTATVLEQAGRSVTTIYQSEKQSKSICTDGGHIGCKRIYFIPCPQMSTNADKWIFRDFVSEAIRLAVNDPTTLIQSIAFPAIGCGQYHCDLNFVAKTLVMAAAYELRQRPSLQLDIYFVIQQRQINVFDAFINELTILKNNESPYTNDQLSANATCPAQKSSRRCKKENEFVVEKRLVDDSSQEYTRVINEFWSSMSSKRCNEIVRVEFIWNERWYKQYQVHRDEFSQRLKDDTEKLLFHGCSETAANNIIKTGFDRSYAGQHGTSYGYGVYFSSKASYSHSYATVNANGARCMFLARVLIGKTIVGSSTTKVCPDGYDSTTDGSHIYVIYHDTQAFGEYLITYK